MQRETIDDEIHLGTEWVKTAVSEDFYRKNEQGGTDDGAGNY